jgi:hypothetical protein
MESTDSCSGMGVYLMQFRAGINKFDVSGPAETLRDMDERRLATVNTPILGYRARSAGKSHRVAC